MKLRFYLFLLTWMAIGAVQSQDLHFSMFNMSPLTLNPAQTGAFEGTARIGGIYRDQWGSFLKDQFTTPSIYIDAPIIQGLRKQDWVGVGVSMFSDKAGTAELTTAGSLFSASYHAGLGKGNKHYFTVGVQGGTVQRRIKLTNEGIRFEDELSESVGGGGVGIGNGADRGIQEKASYTDINLGFMLRSTLNEKTRSEFGFALAHLGQPKYGLALTGGGQTGNKPEKGVGRPMRVTAHGLVKYQFSDKLAIEPSALIQLTTGGAEVVVQAMAGYGINEDFVLRMGPGYRVGDAGQVLLGMDYKRDLRVGVSYDVNLSSLSGVSKLQGGFELAASYIVKIYKKPKISPAILCPQL